MIPQSRTFRALALILFLLLCLLATAPARLLGLVVPSQLLVMQGFSGSLWQGQASRCLLQTPAGFLHLGAVSWKLSPFSLLLFTPQLALESTWGSQFIRADVALRGAEDVDLKHVEANISAGLVRQFAPVELVGEFQVQAQILSLRGGLPSEVKGRLVWLNGGWDSPTGPLPLGSYAVDFTQMPGQPLAGEVITLAGDVTAQGTVELDGNAYSVNVTVLDDTGLDSRLQQALSLMARPVENGFHIKLGGDL